MIVKALLFDVFGTLVDWRTSVTAQLTAYFADPERQCYVPQDVQWEHVTLDWRGCYQPSMQAVRSGQRPFVILDVLHRESLRDTLRKHGFSPLPDGMLDELILCWHRLDPWPDVPDSMQALRPLFTLAALSNGNTELLKALSHHARLPWHVSLGAEATRSYKPQSQTYLQSAAMLTLEPSECMMVAAHNNDLQAARALGFNTAYINRPTEYGVRQDRDTGPESNWDYSVSSLAELSQCLIEHQT